MKLYYSPGACSLADHIALHEAGLPFEHERVDLKTKQTEHGADFRAVNPKGYVPALTLDSGETLTENVAVLDWIADQSPALKPDGPLGRTRQLELLGYLSSELHKAFGPLFRGGDEAQQAAAKEAIAGKLAFLAGRLEGDYLAGARPGVADFYLLVMLLWSDRMAVAVPEPLKALRDRLLQRDAVQKAMKHEGLI